MKSLLMTLLISCTTANTMAQDTYPARPVTAIVGYLPGGSADMVMRRLAAILAPKFPAGLIVENKPGVGGSLAVSTLSKAKPDGYQFAFTPNSNVALSPQINQLAYKNPDDLAPVISTVNFAPVLLVPSNSPYQTLRDLLEAAKKSPDTISVGFPGVTSLSHLNLLELQRTAGVKFIDVAQKGWGEGGPQLLGGHVTAAIAQPIEALPYLKTGKVRALGSFSSARQSALPDVPTFKEQGFPADFDVRYLIVVPKGTPTDISKYIHDAVKAAIETPEFKKFSAENGLDIVYQEAAAAREAAWSDYHRYTLVLKQTGLLK